MLEIPALREGLLHFMTCTKCFSCRHDWLRKRRPTFSPRMFTFSMSKTTGETKENERRENAFIWGGHVPGRYVWVVPLDNKKLCFDGVPASFMESGLLSKVLFSTMTAEEEQNYLWRTSLALTFLVFLLVASHACQRNIFYLSLRLSCHRGSKETVSLPSLKHVGAFLYLLCRIFLPEEWSVRFSWGAHLITLIWPPPYNL